MKNRSSLTTLALALAFALAAILGILLPSGNPIHAAPPVFDTDPSPDTRMVPENTPAGVNIGLPILATDTDEVVEFGDTLTYSLGGTDAASFDIDPSTGQLLTKAPLDYENPTGGTTNDSLSYVVIVTVKDSSGTSVNSVDQEVTITVTNVVEEPGAVAAPTVVSTDSDDTATTYELKVIWYPPDDTVDEITSYAVEYKKTTDAAFTPSTDAQSGDAVRTVNITGLEVDTSYQVRVRATNAGGDGPWSLSGVGSTNKKDNALPTFVDGAFARSVLENAEPGLVVGAKVSAKDTDNVLPLTYRLHGPDANSFDLQASTGQIRTKRGVVYDFETRRTLNVTVTVSDGQGGTDATAVTISVTDVPEAPSRPERPTVRATERSSRSLDVSWKEPDNTGPAITGYDLRYRKGNSGRFRTADVTGTGTTYTLAPPDDGATTEIDERLEPGSSYEVYVRAKSLEAITGGEWSAAGTGRTSAGNVEPRFGDRTSPTEAAPSTTRTVAENTRAGQSVGRAVTAVDGNGDKRTYRLVAATPGDTGVAKFDINKSTGQILTKDPLNHEAKCSAGDESLEGGHTGNCTYTVKVEVWDGLDDDRNEQVKSSLDDTDDTNDEAIIDDAITVTIKVSDVTERPAAPTVTVTSSAVSDGVTTATLTVTWDMPENMGPALTGYDVECTGDGITTANPCPQPTAITDFTVTPQTYDIADLTPNKPYRVRVRAKNAEGDGAWSSWVTQSTSKPGNVLPAFSGPPAELRVEENAASPQQPLTIDDGTVTTIPASDTDGDTVTLRLEGPGAGRFQIDSTGQIKTRSKLNHEDPECGYYNADVTTECSYIVRIKASDPNGGSFFHALEITVVDRPEPPAKPPAPRVTATTGSGWSLEVTWNAPRNDGSPITGYQIRYRKTGDSAAVWQQWPHTGTDRSAKITTIRSDPADAATEVHLEPRTQYEVQVRALNGEGDPDTFGLDPNDNWSSSGRGSTGASNSRPVFDSDLPLVVELEVEENTRSGQNIGNAIEATDPDKNRLAYTLEGPGKDSFTITNAGQIRTRSPLNHEERDKYSLTVKVNDGQRKNNSVAAKSVIIMVTDRDESPSTPAAPRVAGIPGSTDSVRVTWDEPANPGPAITHYNLRFAVIGSRDAFIWVDPPTGSADRSSVITGLAAGTRYDVQIRAWNAEGHSEWSRSGRGSPNPDAANRNPAFSNRSHTFSVAENTPPGADVGSLIAALDPDGDTLTYALEGTDSDSFDIIATSGAGQIQTKAALNYEEKSSYSVSVRTRDGRGGTDAVNVTIRVTDIDTEAPDTPFAPTVTALSSTSLQVNWDTPENDGPPITDYDYRYRHVSAPTQTWTEVTNTTITGTSVTVDGLTASTSYDVEVRAKNAEGTSDWSSPGNAATNAPGANNQPVFTDGISATRTVSATASAGASIGRPVTATDSDSDDTLTYSLEGRDAGLFEIDATNGQLRTRFSLIAGETYKLTVAVDDGTESARIDVSIEATAGPPNNPPVFRDGVSTTRSVSRSARAGTAIGTPITATDSDPGSTLTYSLVGPNSQSFTIDSSTGQLRTRAGVTLPVASYPVTVVATDDRADSARITVTITVTNRPPTFASATTSRSVPKGSPSGTAVGAPVSATDADPDDTLAYSLAGTDAASFTIDSSTGQLSTQGIVAQELSPYTVTVTAADLVGATASITVTINVINREPVFTATSTSRSVDRNAAPRAPVGDAVTATDPDPGDTLTYSLTGTDAASFNIDGATGQLRTRAGVAIDQASYTVAVVATDQDGATARIAVTITVDNRAPVFPSTSASRSVDRNSAAGTPVGGPVTATDADPGDSVTYSLAGTDAASFSINSLNGQMLTRENVTLDEDAYTVAVVATDELAASASITVMIEVTGTLIGRFDTDGDGSISRDEVFMAILEFLGGQATRDEILGVILIYISP